MLDSTYLLATFLGLVPINLLTVAVIAIFLVSTFLDFYNDSLIVETHFLSDNEF